MFGVGLMLVMEDMKFDEVESMVPSVLQAVLSAGTIHSLKCTCKLAPLYIGSIIFLFILAPT